MRKFDGRVVAITGAGSGIGRALAAQFASQGAHLALSDIDEVGLAETVTRCEGRGVKVTSQRVDVSDRGSMFAWADQVVAEHGKVNVVVNNAGVAVASNIDTVSFEDFEWLMGINFWGVVHGTKAFLPHLKASRDGHIVNISSVFGLVSVPSQGTYNAAKFAVRGFTEALRQEMLIAKHPVKVTCVHPGGIKTAVARNATVAEGENAQTLAEFYDKYLLIHSPEMAAKTILNGVQHGRARVVIGLEAKAADLLVRIVGPSYQRIVATAASTFFPWAK